MTHRHEQQRGDHQRKGRWGRWKWAKEGYIGMKRDFTLGDGHMMQCADDVWVSFTLETCMVLLTNGTPISSVKRSYHLVTLRVFLYMK